MPNFVLIVPDFLKILKFTTFFIFNAVSWPSIGQTISSYTALKKVEVDFFPEIDYFLKSTKSRDLFLCVDFNRLFWGEKSIV